ncbi:Imm1 family immunity protein [Kribbella solani]|uniref:Imm1 family immunity protein n=1 Tax=Kribbella solani TaxID=236067 RepID=UPI0029AA203B|nr:Imm1 family immunity protein [Kribbella solani]MDX2972365.1 Imm1 family immunity protein [Kribbella solani]
MSKVEAYYKHGHGDNPVILTNAADADALVDAMLAEPFQNSVAALYDLDRPGVEAAPEIPDHELRIAVDAKADVGGIRYAGGDDQDVRYVPGATSQREEMFYIYMDHGEGWPKDSVVSIEQVRQAVREFVEGNGARPTSFEWRELPEGVL